MLWETASEAIRNDDLEATKIFFKQQAPVFGEQAYTPLELACACGRLSIVVWMLDEGGADPNIVTQYDGRTPLHASCMTASESVSRVLVENLLRAGSKVDPVDWVGLTPLDIALSYKRYKCAELLMDHGADIQKAKNAHRHKDFFLHMSTLRCKRVAMLVLAFRKFSLSRLMCSNGIDVARVLARTILETCQNSAWLRARTLNKKE